MAVYQRGNVWWYKFVWNSQLIRASTKQSNKRVAEHAEAIRKASLAKGEAGIKEAHPGTHLQRVFGAIPRLGRGREETKYRQVLQRYGAHSIALPAIGCGEAYTDQSGSDREIHREEARRTEDRSAARKGRCSTHCDRSCHHYDRAQP